MVAGPLSARVIQLCEATRPELSAANEPRVAEIERRLGDPLRVAIAGRINAGKSTLVNALIGRRIAPTDEGECTRVVTQFRYGTSDRVTVIRHDGMHTVIPLDADGMIPRSLGVPPAEVSYVDVTLALDRLRDLTVMDTPGLSSTSVPRGSRGPGAPEHPDTEPPHTKALPAPADENLDAESLSAAHGAEAIVYVYTQAIRDDDRTALETFASLSTRLSSTPINSLGLFNKVDKLTGGGDPWPVAEPLAQDQARLLRRQVSAVVPVVGLLAETVEAGLLTTADFEAVRQLAVLPTEERTLLLASVDLFVEYDCVVDRSTRARLLALLDLYGIAFAIAMLRAEPNLSLGVLLKRLDQASGFTRARYLLDRTLRHRADAIKASSALVALDQLAAGAEQHSDAETLRDAIEQLMTEPEYHHLLVIGAAQQVTTGQVSLPDDMEAEAVRLALSTDPAWILHLQEASASNLIASATAAAVRWRVFAVSEATPAQARVAHVIHRGFHLMVHQLKTPGTP